MVYERYGPPEVLQLRDVPKPTPGDDEVLISVHAASVTAADWRLRKADPFAARMLNGLFRPSKFNILGFEIAGEVEEAGGAVTRFKPGDRVFGYTGWGYGAYAEYRCLPADSPKQDKGLLAKLPKKLSFEDAAVIPFGGLAAYGNLGQAGVRKGQKVMVYAASGASGVYGVQLAKHLGAEVTGVCSLKNHKLVRSLGADKVIDYRKEDVTRGAERYDFIFDAVGKMIHKIPKSGFKRILAPGGQYLSVETSRKDTKEELATLGKLFADGKLKAVIDRRYPLEKLAEAHAYAETMRKKGCVVIRVREDR
jgi:NADPH:quinone reductase-like Zn-dependent oxidoreductase